MVMAGHQNMEEMIYDNNDDQESCDFKSVRSSQRGILNYGYFEEEENRNLNIEDLEASHMKVSR